MMDEMSTMTIVRGGHESAPILRFIKDPVPDPHQLTVLPPVTDSAATSAATCY
jgi:hypothetical protein